MDQPHAEVDTRVDTKVDTTLDTKVDTALAPEVEILFVSMPFGPLTVPALGPELLKGTVPGKRCRVRYFTLDFAAEIGVGLYDAICTRWGFGRTMVGDWLFSDALAPDPGTPEGLEARAAAYFEAVGLADRLSHQEVEGLLAAGRRIAPFLERCRREIARLRPRIVGFTSTFQQQIASLALARQLRHHHPELFLALGGANCEGAMGLGTVRRFPFVDAVVSGEAEEVFPRLVERVFAGRPVDDLPGVYTPGNQARLDRHDPPDAPRPVSLDQVPRPDFDDFFTQWRAAELETEQRPRLLFETSRGCWWGEHSHCTFCGLNGGGMAFRSKSPERAFDELAGLARRYPGTRVLVVDNILDMRYFKTFLPRLAEAGLGVELFYEVKANLSKDQLRQLRAAGVGEIQPGIESLSDDVLERMGKGVRGLVNIQVLKWCRELGLWPAWHLIWGFPGEPAAEYDRMAEWIPLLSHLPPPGDTSKIRLDRFSPNFERAAELGFTDLEPNPAYRHIYRGLEDDALFDLAYDFRYAYQDGRRPEDYTRAVVEQVAQWRRDHPRSALFQVEKGDQLWVWDLRPVARRPLTCLEGMARDLYLACDGVRTLRGLARQLGSSPLGEMEVEVLAEPLVAAGLMLRDGDRLLSLAVAGKAGPSAALDDRALDDRASEERLSEERVDQDRIVEPLGA